MNKAPRTKDWNLTKINHIQLFSGARTDLC
jgi:hypothetical protein